MGENLISEMDMQQLNEIRVALEQSIVSKLDKAGIYHRSYSRVKTEESLAGKLATGKYRTDYDVATSNNTKSDGTPKKIQDIIGLRINLFFYEDINICESILDGTYMVDNWSKSKRIENQFEAQKRNCVCKLPSKYVKKLSPELWSLAIDQTFEVQLRTLLFEGWHEIEHDMRYKNKYGKGERNALSVGTLKEDYINQIRNNIKEEERKLSRVMNSVIANLELCDWSLVEIYDDLSNVQVMQHEWDKAFLSKYRLNMSQGDLCEEVVDYFNEHPDIAKSFFEIKKSDLIDSILSERVATQLTINRLVYIINDKFIKDENIEKMLINTFGVREKYEKFVVDIHPLTAVNAFRQDTYIPEDGFSDAVNIIYDWGKAHMENIFANIPDEVVTGTYETIGHKLIVNYDSEKTLFNMDLQHISGSEAGVIWHVTAKIVPKAKGLKLMVRNICESYTPKHRGYIRPEFVRAIYSAVGMEDAGYLIKENVLPPKLDYDELDALVNNPDRNIPVLVASKPEVLPEWAANYDGYILNVKMLRRSVGGLCHFVIVDNECIERLREELKINIDCGGMVYYKQSEDYPQVFTMNDIKESCFEETRQVVEEESHYEKAFRFLLKEMVREEFAD